MYICTTLTVGFLIWYTWCASVRIVPLMCSVAWKESRLFTVSHRTEARFYFFEIIRCSSVRFIFFDERTVRCSFDFSTITRCGSVRILVLRVLRCGAVRLTVKQTFAPRCSLVVTVENPRFSTAVYRRCSAHHSSNVVKTYGSEHSRLCQLTALHAKNQSCHVK